MENKNKEVEGVTGLAGCCMELVLIIFSVLVMTAFISVIIWLVKLILS